MFRKRRRESLGVVEEDVDPDPRIGSRDPRHVTERATCRSERLVSVDSRCARLIEENVRERMRQMTGQRD